MLTTSEVATRLKFSRATVCEMIRRGEIKAERWGRQWRVRDDALVKPDAKPSKPHLSKQARLELEMWEMRRARSAM